MRGSGIVYAVRKGMKHFFALFAALLTVSLLALGAAYIDSRMRPQHNEEHLWHDTLQRLNELARQQHHQSVRYQQYAIHAQQAQEPQVAVLFRAMAFGEEVKCEKCKDAIGALGGLFDPPIEATTTITTVEEHIRKAIDEKQEYHDTKVRDCIAGAVGEGNRWVARMLTWCDASDLKMVLLLRQVSADCARGESDDVAQGEDEDMARCEVCYWVCPNCGNIVGEQMHTCYCPHCMTPCEEFVRFE